MVVNFDRLIIAMCLFFVSFCCSCFTDIHSTWGGSLTYMEQTVSCSQMFVNTSRSLWVGNIYRGRSEEKKALRYIFSKSRCLKRAGISLESTCNPKDREMMVKELESMSRVSKSSQLLFFTHLEYMTSELWYEWLVYIKDHILYHYLISYHL